MNFLERLQGIFFNPQQTFHYLADKPVWKDALIIVLIVFAAFSYIVAPYAQKDNVTFMENNVRLKERMGEERFEQTLENMRNPSKGSTILRGLVFPSVSLVVGFLFSSLILLVMGRLTSTEGKYIQVFSALIHANFIDKIFGSGVRLILILMKKSVMQTTTSLAALFPQMEVMSPGYLILGQFDIFQLWMFGVLAYGISRIFKIDLKKALFVSYGFWLLKSLLYVAMGLLSMSFVR